MFLQTKSLIIYLFSIYFTWIKSFICEVTVLCEAYIQSRSCSRSSHSSSPQNLVGSRNHHCKKRFWRRFLKLEDLSRFQVKISQELGLDTMCKSSRIQIEDCLPFSYSNYGCTKNISKNCHIKVEKKQFSIGNHWKVN